jgi:hypothetical protein
MGICTLMVKFVFIHSHGPSQSVPAIIQSVEELVCFFHFNPKRRSMPRFPLANVIIAHKFRYLSYIRC